MTYQSSDSVEKSNVGEITRELNIQSKHLENLDMKMESLELSIAPILSPHDVKSSIGDTDRAEMSQLAIRIAKNNHELSDLINWIESLIERVEL